VVLKVTVLADDIGERVVLEVMRVFPGLGAGDIAPLQAEELITGS
jgi:hypothetical protein